MSKPAIPQGTRDFSPEVMFKRKFILDQIESTYKLFGFMPLETPAIENLSTLTGKYGSEGDRLLYKILNSGDYLKDISLAEQSSQSLSKLIAEKGLRYDLTVPLARFVAMNRHEIQFPFKRYQVQPVWRADRPQKGRYREFWQCDADILGSDSMLCETDLIQIYRQVFLKLGIKKYEIRINHRKILEAVCEKAGASEWFKAITIIIDKADKIGLEGVRKELITLGLNQAQTETIFLLLKRQTLSPETIHQLAQELGDIPSFQSAEKDLRELLDFLGNKTEHLVLDGSLARGLDYYTGCIFEVVASDVSIGSISGGGRYDDLTAVFGLKEKVSGIGISFGIDRLYDLMQELQIFPSQKAAFTEVLFCPLEPKAISYCMDFAEQLRTANYKTEVYPAPVKLKKQLDYANAKGVKHCIIIGDNEMKEKRLTVKNMDSGVQEELAATDLLSYLNKA